MPTDPPDRATDAALLRRTRLHLVAWSGGLTLLLIVVLGALAYGAVASSLAGRGVSLLDDRATQIARSISGSGRFGQDRVGMAFGGTATGTLAYVIGPDGTVLGDSRILVDGLPDASGVTAAEAASGAPDVRDAEVAGTAVRIYSTAVARGDQTWVVQVIGERDSEVQLLNALLVVLLGGGLVATVLASLVGFFYAGRALVPIRASMAGRDAALARQRDFAANASHELRSPLTVIRTSVTALRRTPAASDTDAAETLDDIQASTEHLAALIDDLLLLARTDSGVMEIERTRVDLGDVAAEASGALIPIAAARGVTLIADPLPTAIDGDPLRLRQLVTILVDNALAHSPAGSTFDVRVRTEDQAALLVVEDRGPGIRPEDLPRVFDRFWRADNAPAGGTGLGLSIAKWIADRHGGTIRAENRPDGGARFVARFPLTASAPARAPS